MEAELLGVATLAAVAAVAVLRWAWSLTRRCPAMNAAGWGLLLLATLFAGMSAGAWGIAIASLVAMAAAILLLLWAAVTAPPGRASASNRRVHMLPEAGEPLRIGGRLLTCLLVVIAGLAASIAFAIAIQAAALGLGWSEADANALALIASPFTWGVLAAVLVMQPSRPAQIAILVIASLPLVPALFVGS